MSMNRVRMRQISVPCLAGALGLLAALAWMSFGVTLPGAADEHPATAPAAHDSSRRVGAPSERLTATVSAVDLEKRTIDLMTGVGHALRIRRVQLAQGLRVRVGKRDSAPGVLTPGCLVRIECGHTTGGTVASSVTLLAAPTRGHQP